MEGLGSGRGSLVAIVLDTFLLTVVTLEHKSQFKGGTVGATYIYSGSNYWLVYVQWAGHYRVDRDGWPSIVTLDEQMKKLVDSPA